MNVLNNKKKIMKLFLVQFVSVIIGYYIIGYIGCVGWVGPVSIWCPYGMALYFRTHTTLPMVMVATHSSGVNTRTIFDGFSPRCSCVNVLPSKVHTLFTLRPSMVSSSNSSPNLKLIFVNHTIRERILNWLQYRVCNLYVLDFRIFECGFSMQCVRVTIFGQVYRWIGPVANCTSEITNTFGNKTTWYL